MTHEAPPRDAILIVNARSRKGKQQFAEARRLLTQAGITLSATHALEEPSKLPGLVRDAVAAKAQMVIVGGGDGSLSCAVDLMVGSDTVFAVLPLGTANSFARALELPLDLEGAIKVIVEGQVKRVDLGMIDQDYFAGCASIGIAPKIAQTVPHGLKAWAGRPGYLMWAGLQFARFSPFELTVHNGDRVERLSAVEVRIANGAFHGGVELVDAAKLDSGKIVVHAVTGQSRRDLLFNWVAHLVGSSRRHRTTLEFSGEEITIETDPPQSISIDGEVLATTPITARVSAGALRVVAP